MTDQEEGGTQPKQRWAVACTNLNKAIAEAKEAWEEVLFKGGWQVTDQEEADALAAKIGAPGTQPKPTPRVKKPVQQSRIQRWAAACTNLNNAIAEAKEAWEELRSLQEEYQEWKDNLPENLQASALGEKLEEVTNLDLASIESSLDEAESVASDAEGIDLPQGFGRD